MALDSGILPEWREWWSGLWSRPRWLFGLSLLHRRLKLDSSVKMFVAQGILGPGGQPGLSKRLGALDQRGRCHLRLHVVVCEETWAVVDAQGNTLTKTARHAWLSSRPLTRDNLHERCNLAARYRWGIEVNLLVEKHQGYHYEHAFTLSWNVMKGYHYLMHLAHLFNALARLARHLRELYRELGVRGARAFIRSSCAAPWLDPERMRRLLAEPLQLQIE